MVRGGGDGGVGSVCVTVGGDEVCCSCSVLQCVLQCVRVGGDAVCCSCSVLHCVLECVAVCVAECESER